MTPHSIYNLYGIRTQYVSLFQGGIPFNPGWVEQTLNIATSGTYNLTFNHLSGPTTIIKVSWNNISLIQIASTNMSPESANLTIDAIQGLNTIRFTHLGIDNGGSIDNISLTLLAGFSTTQNSNSIQSTRQILSQQAMMTIAGIISTPLGSLPIFRHLFLIVTDLWLYKYDVRNYTGTVNDVFETVSYIENVKFDILSEIYNIELTQYKYYLPISNYTNFTNSKFLASEGASTVFIDSNFLFFIFSIPQVIAFSVLLFLLYKVIQKFSISRFFRRFLYIKSVILTSLLQENIPFFSYVLFGHLCSCSFSFVFLDKLWTILTVLLMFVLVFFSVNFYFLIGKYLRKGGEYFRDEVSNSNPGNILLTIVLFRGFIRGAVYLFLRQIYVAQMVFLVLIEFCLIIVTIRVQMKSFVYMSKISFVRSIIYHFLHIILNISFLLEFIFPSTLFYVRMQQITIYSFAGLGVVVFIFEIAYELFSSISQCINSNKIQSNQILGVKHAIQNSTVQNVEIKMSKIEVQKCNKTQQSKDDRKNKMETQKQIKKNRKTPKIKKQKQQNKGLLKFECAKPLSRQEVSQKGQLLQFIQKAIRTEKDSNKKHQKQKKGRKL